MDALFKWAVDNNAIVILFMGIAIVFLAKVLNVKEKEIIKNNDSHKLELAEVNKDHKSDVEKLNEQALSLNRDTFETLTELTNVLKQVRNDNR